ncbi:protein YgfX [Photobacterium sp. DNB22_13_2]
MAAVKTRHMQQWSIRLLPTTTANFADLTLTPSYRLMCALASLYACALVLLLLCTFLSPFPWPVFFVVGWWLFNEWERRFADICQLAGRLQISNQGDIRWQKKQWRLKTARIRTGLILVWHLEGVSGQMIWLPICPDACSGASYRSLALYSHHHRTLSG